MLKTAASFVLVSLRGSTYPIHPLHWKRNGSPSTRRPSLTAAALAGLLNILRILPIASEIYCCEVEAPQKLQPKLISLIHRD
jgi:hypothetical protein